MKRHVFQLPFIIIFVFFIINLSYSQCDYFEDFSSSGDWTQVGTNVQVSGGEVQYINGAADGVQRRIYKELDSPFSSDDCWVMNLEFIPESVGSKNGEPFTAHLIFSLTEDEGNPLHDCPNVNCTGYPIGTQDAIIVDYTTLNPPNGDLLFKIIVKDNSTKYDSEYLTYNGLGNIIYLELTKGCDGLILSIFDDENHQNPIGDGSVTLDLPILADLNYIQHGNQVGGAFERELTGSVDNVCIEIFESCLETYSTIEYEGCESDGYEVEVNGTIYNENNPTGIETLTNSIGCDSIVTIELVYHENTSSKEHYEGCSGDGYEVEVNGTIYDEFNPFGIEVMTNANGCDSTITIELIFHNSTTGLEYYEGCEGDGYEVEVNGTIYSENNTLGIETLTDIYGCDSTVTIELFYFENTTGEEYYEGCEGDGYVVEVNGILYNEANPLGTEYLTNANDCDSIVTIELTFHENAYGEESYEGCSGDGYSIEVNGNIYDELNPNGTEYIPYANNCDSIVSIDLIFHEATYGEEYYEGCFGDGYEIEVNGTVYNEFNPIGTETLSDINDCDSIVTIELLFFESTTGEEYYEGCKGDDYFVIVNGNIYDEDITSGIEILTSASGCDSVVTIELLFFESTSGEEYYEGCKGDDYFVIINGNIYDEDITSGTEILTNANGCDSIVTIDLIFNEITFGEEIYEGCVGDDYFVIVNGNIYDEDITSGTEVLTNSNGCDSIVTIDLVFKENSTGTELYEGCKGDGYMIDVNGAIYDETNPVGTEKLSNSIGCDSIVVIDLIYHDNTSSEVNYQGCFGDGYEIVVNGTTYNENKPTGTENLSNQYGCDSIVTINLVYNENIQLQEGYNGCKGDGYFIEINGNVYDESNPTGTETLPSDNGCDTIVTINLNFYENSTSEVTYKGCEGDGYSVEVNGTIYDELNPNGAETLTNTNGCDSIVKINLVFHESYVKHIEYVGKKGDGYSVEINNVTYNEDNPSGRVSLRTINDCDSILIITLVFRGESAVNEIGKSETKFDLFPNPTNNSVYLDIKADALTNLEVYYKIILPDGVVLEETKIINKRTKLDLKKYGVQGIYFIQLIDKYKNIIEVKKAILQY